MTHIISEQEQNYYRYRARLDYLREQSSICCYHQGMTKEILDIVMETEKILSPRLELLSESSSEYQEIQLKLMENISKQELLKKEYEGFHY